MAHCPSDAVADLRSTLDEIGAWYGLKEPKPGILYLKRLPFLHLHIDRDGRRTADVRDGADWGAPIAVPSPASATVQRRLLAEARRRHAATLAHLAGPRHRTETTR